jgi:fluoride exporter
MNDSATCAIYAVRIMHQRSASVDARHITDWIIFSGTTTLLACRRDRFILCKNPERTTMLLSIVAIGIGAAFGALLRWLFGMQWNALFPLIPLGTLAANLVGGYLIGVAVVFFGNAPTLPPEWRLFVITGFLGGLTTFSTFSAEVVTLIQEDRFAWAFGAISVHVLGSLLMTMLGMVSMRLLRGA